MFNVIKHYLANNSKVLLDFIKSGITTIHNRNHYNVCTSRQNVANSLITDTED